MQRKTLRFCGNLTRCLTLCLRFVALNPLHAQLVPASFTLDFQGPRSVGGVPGSNALAAFKCRLSAATAGPGLPPGEGATGWSLGVEAVGDCELSFATTLATVAADVTQGGLRSGGFELTELTTGVGNKGAVSVVVLSNSLPISLPPETGHHLLGVEVTSAALPVAGCLPCTVRYRSGLVSSSGTAIDVNVTALGAATLPDTLDATVELCGVACFANEPIHDWNLWTVGNIAAGAARYQGDRVEVCSSSRGYGGASDSLLLLARDVPGDFTLEADVVAVEGEAGVEARDFTATGADPYAATLRISVRQVVVIGGGSEAEIVTGFRARSGDEMQPSPVPIPVSLPVRVGVRRQGSVLTAYHVSGADRFDLVTVSMTGTGLEGPLLRAGLTHGSDPASTRPVISGLPRRGTASFRGLTLTRPPDPELPLIARAVRGSQGVPNRSTTMILEGLGLEAVQTVTVAGFPTEIVARRENEIEIRVPPTLRPTRGDIEVETPNGVTVLPNSFFSYGEEFIRGDCNGDGQADLSDAVASLANLFLGGARCRCAEAQDVNDDDQVDVSDPVFLLIHLFLGGGQHPPPPFPAPGFDTRTGLCFPELPVVAGVSLATITAGDIFTITGTGFSPIPQENIVLVGDAIVRVLAATETTLTVEAELVVSGGETPVFVALDFKVASPLPACARRGCFKQLAMGPMGTDSTAAVRLLTPAEPELKVFATSRNEHGLMILDFDPTVFDPTRPIALHASLISTVVPDVAPGARVTQFEHSLARGAETTFEDALGELAERLDRELSGGGPLREVVVLADPANARIVIEPQHPAVGGPGVPCVFTAIYYDYLNRVSGRCGPQQIRPVTFQANTEREFAWCRFQELVQLCNGLPRFEWFIPLQFVTSKTGSLVELTHPDNLSPKQKAILYNSEAYCHVRQYGLWNRCVLEDLRRGGATDIPDFPRDASVVKTEWRTDDPGAPVDDRLGADLDKSKFYSYVYPGDGRTWYLTALHHITQDLPSWFWYDIYVPRPTPTWHEDRSIPPLHAGTGGCGGTNLDAPAPVATSIWRHYFLCSNVLPQQPYKTNGFAGVGPDFTQPTIQKGSSAWCGNFEFSSECPDVFDGGGGQDTCVGCHLRARAPTCQPLGLDQLYSLANPIAVPDPCLPPCPTAPTGTGTSQPVVVTYKAHIAPIFASCSCHNLGEFSKGGLELAPQVSHANLVNKQALQSVFLRVKPGMPEQSYLWLKLQNTHQGPPAFGTGDCMPLNNWSAFHSSSSAALIKKWIENGAAP